MDSDPEERKLIETRYGERVLKKLLEGYTLDQQRNIISEKERRYREERQNELAARKYIRENTVIPSPDVSEKE